MSALTFQQTATTHAVTPNCSSRTAAGGTVLYRTAEKGGTAGGALTLSLLASEATKVAYYCKVTVPSTASWAAGTWTCRLNVTTANKYLTLEEVYICRVNSSNVNQATIGSSTGLALAMGTPGVLAPTVTGSAQTPGAGDYVMVIYIFSNSSTMATQEAGVTLNQLITSPFTIPPPFTQTDYRWRNDDGDEDAATWFAAANTAIDTAPGTKRVRVRVTNTDPGSSAFGWQYRRQPFVLITSLPGSSEQRLYGNTGTDEAKCQSFTAELTGSMTELHTYMYKQGTPTDNVFCQIRITSQTGTVQGTSDDVAATSIGTFPSYGLVTFQFSTPVALTKDTVYFVVFERDGARDTSNFCALALGALQSYSGGTLSNRASGVWSNLSDDAPLRVGGTDWLALPAQDTADVPLRFKASANVTDAEATTEQMAGALTFVAGRMYETAHTSTVTFTGAQETELEAVIEMVTGQVADGEVYQVRAVEES